MGTKATPHTPAVQARRPHPCLELRPAREMSGRAFAGVIAIYALLFGAATLHFLLSG